MFLILSLFVVIFVFWFSSFLAEIILSSKQENLLNPGVRSGIGFFISVAYFSASWQVMTIQNAWKLGGVILILYAYGKYGHPDFKNITSFLKNFFYRYIKAFGVYMVGGILFFLPLFIGNNYGPFTEGGGDITIYADAPEFLTDNHLTLFGQEQPTLKEGKALLNAFLDVTNINKSIRYSELTSDFRVKNKGLFDPPNAIHQTYRLVKEVFFLSSHYAPYAQLYFFSNDSNYHIYFGVQAFLYACILYSIWSCFSNLSRRTGILSFAIAAASHGLISVNYNHYSLQATSMAATALVLASVSLVPVFSWPGARIYGVIWSYIAVIYTHFLALISPLILIALKFIPRKICDNSIDIIKKRSISRQTATFLVMAIILFLLALYLATGITQSYNMIKMALHISSETESPYYGESVPVLSWKWLSFAFGFLSQQHYLPFVTEVPFVLFTNKIGIVFGFIVLALGLSLIINLAKAPINTNMVRKKFYLTTYGILILLVTAHLSFLNASLYAQAKNAQNLLIFLYIAMLIPYALSSKTEKENAFIFNQRNILWGSIMVFFVALIIPRIVNTAKLGLGAGRSSIMEVSYFNEIKKIIKLDKKPFILFEPRKNADTVLNMQPLSGARMVTTRHLHIKTSTKKGFKFALAQDFIKQQDLPHLWVLYARGKKRWMSSGYDYTWNAERLLDQKVPRTLLFADNYERNIRKSPLNKPSDIRTFSYLKNGAAVLYHPTEIEGKIKVTITPKHNDKKAYEALVKDIRQRSAQNEFGKEVVISGNGEFVFFDYQLSAKKIPSLKVIAHSSSEYFINIQFNGKDL